MAKQPTSKPTEDTKPVSRVASTETSNTNTTQADDSKEPKLNPNGTEKQNTKPFLERSRHAQDQENISPVELAKQQAEAGVTNADGNDPMTGQPPKDSDKK